MRKMQDAIAAAALLLITDLTRISMTSISHDFRVGDRVEMTYCYVVPRAYPGSVTRVTANSMLSAGPTLAHSIRPCRYDH